MNQALPLKKQHLWLHTNIPAPYRKHQFEAFALAFPETTVFFYETMHSDRKAWVGDIQSWGVRCVNLPVNDCLKKFSWFSFSLLWKLMQQPKGTIHLVGAVGGAWRLILFCCLLRRSKFVLWNDGGFPETISDRMLQFHRKFILPHCAAVFTPGNLGKSFCQRLGFSDAKIFNAYFSHDVKEFRAFYQAQRQQVREQIRHDLAISRDAIVILCVARFLAWKRLVDLAEALSLLEGRLNAGSPPLELILVGEGEDLSHQPVLQRLRTIRVHSIPRVPYSDMKGFYCASDLFVFPSEGDIWGLVVNEALSFGVPVICTTRIGAAELVENGTNGFQVTVRNPGQIASCLEKLINDPELLVNMKRNALSIWDTWNTVLAVDELKRMIFTVA